MRDVNNGDIVHYYGSVDRLYGQRFKVLHVPEDRDGRGYVLSGSTILSNVHRESFKTDEEEE